MTVQGVCSCGLPVSVWSTGCHIIKDSETYCMWIWGTARFEGIQRKGWSQRPQQDVSSGTVDYHVLKLTTAHPGTNWTNAVLSGGGRNWILNCHTQMWLLTQTGMTLVRRFQCGNICTAVSTTVHVAWKVQISVSFNEMKIVWDFAHGTFFS